MGLMATDDLAQMAADLAEARGDNEESIVIRRGDSVLAAQDVRIVRQGGTGAEQDSDSSQEARGKVLVCGASGLDIQAGDRFNDSNGTLFAVLYVRPNRTVDTVAEAEAVQ